MDSILIVIKRHFFLGIGVFVFSMVTISLVHTMSPKVYEVKSSVYIQRQIPSQYSEHNYDDMMDHIRILKSNLVLDRIVARLHQSFPQRKDIDQVFLFKRLRIDSGVSGELGQTTKVVDILFQDTNPKLAKKVLDYTLEAYEEALAHIARETRLQGVDFLKSRLANVHTNRQQLADSLQRLETASGTTDIELKNSELIKLKSSFTQLLGTVNADIRARDKQISHLQKLLDLSPEEVKRLVTIRSDPKIENWQKQLAVERGELAKLKATYTDNYPSVLEKEDVVQRLEDLIWQQLQAGYDRNVQSNVRIPENSMFSEMDEALGKQLIELTSQRAALVEQQAYYRGYLEHMGQGFQEIAFEKKDMTDLHFTIEMLQNEEGKLQEKIQEMLMEQANLLSLGSFVVLSPPVEPLKDDEVFPIELKLILAMGTIASTFLAIFSIAIAEFLDPRVILFERFGLILWEFRKKRARTAENLDQEIYRLYQALAMLVKRDNLKAVVFIDLFNKRDRKLVFPIVSSENKKKITGYWYSVSYASALAGLYASKSPDLKILFIEDDRQHRDGVDLFNSFRRKTMIRDLGEVQLYRSTLQENLYLLASENGSEEGLDPYLLESMQKQEQFNLIMIQQSAPPVGWGQDVQTNLRTRASLIQAVSDGVILGISQSGSNVRQLHCIRQVSKQEQMLGCIVFP
jgi:uncharacterized protein involved in exopolysaccharide biosynthesis